MLLPVWLIVGVVAVATYLLFGLVFSIIITHVFGIDRVSDPGLFLKNWLLWPMWFIRNR